MFPEISRRCLECGASVRAGARFCPQCGKQMGDETAAESDGGKGTSGNTAPVVQSLAEAQEEAQEEADAIRLEESWQHWKESLSHKPAEVERDALEAVSNEGVRDDEVGMSAPPPASPEPPAPVESPAPERVGSVGAQSEVAQSALPAPRPETERKGSRAAAVREAVRPRVEKVRDASMGVLEGAAEDSGLRFVLIAVALFVLFVIFLLLSNWLR